MILSKIILFNIFYLETSLLGSKYRVFHKIISVVFLVKNRSNKIIEFIAGTKSKAMQLLNLLLVQNWQQWFTYVKINGFIGIEGIVVSILLL